MKQHYFITLIFLLLIQANIGFGQPPSISNVTLMPPNDPSGINTIPQYEVQEIDFSLYPYYTTPHDPDVIQVYALIDNPSHTKQIRVDAFFYVPYDIQQMQTACSWPCDDPVILSTSRSNDMIFEETIPNKELLNHGYWKIRFTPDEPGNWTVSIFADDNMQVTPHPPFEITCMASLYSKGFVTLANDKYLKHTTGEFFFPVGMNTWSPRYNYDCIVTEPNVYEGTPCEFGTQYFSHMLTNLSENKGNTIRILLDMYAYGEYIGFNLLGPDLNYGNGIGGNYYSFNLYNQKDAAQLDYIIKFAQGHNVKIQLCLLWHGATQIYEKDGNGNITGDGLWITKNPFSYTGNPHNDGFLSSPFDFFTDPLAEKNIKNLFRFYIARWGAYTNILSWELWSEADHIGNGGASPYINTTDVELWHREMYSYIKSIDAYNHLITTSFAGFNSSGYAQICDEVDYVQDHTYKGFPSAPNANTNFQHEFFKHREIAYDNRNLKKPFLIGETGFAGANPSDGLNHHFNDDRKGVELHNSLWSSAFSGHMGSSLNWWDRFYIDNKEGRDLYHLFAPISKFMNSQEIPSQNVTFRMLDFGSYVNGLRLYEISDAENINNTTVMGWVQDDHFHFTNLYNHDNMIYRPYLHDLYTNKPPKSDADNRFAIDVAETGKDFLVEWYSSETGSLFGNELIKSWIRVDGQGYIIGGSLGLHIPEELRRSTFGDAVYKVIRDCNINVWRDGEYIKNVNQNVNTNIAIAKNNGQVFYGGFDKKLYSYWFDPIDGKWKLSSQFPNTNDVEGYIAINIYDNQVYYKSSDNNIKAVWWNGTAWVHIDYKNLTGGNVKGPIVVGHNDEVFYRTLTNDINALIWNGSTYVHSTLNNATTGNVGSSIDIAPNGDVFYRTTDDALEGIQYNSSTWVRTTLDGVATTNTVTSDVSIAPDGRIFFRNEQGQLDFVYYNIYSTPNTWVNNTEINNHVGWFTDVGGTILATGNHEVFLSTSSKDLVRIYKENGEWKWENLAIGNPEDIKLGMNFIYDKTNKYISYVSTNNTAKRLYYKSLCYETPSTDFRKNDPTTMGTKNLEEKVSNKVKIYPNPSNGKFTISSETSIEKWVLKNAIGVSVLTSDKLLKNFDIIDATSLSSGIYFITIVKSNGQESNHKIIIQ
jgi:hypothetical protein